jgi:L-ascorbate metabolism protein UlaG (beta-lactamase superfamily)
MPATESNAMVETLPKIRFYGWSSFVIEGPNGALAFDPFFRPYCGADWSTLADYADVRVVCLTHGHQEHYLDCHRVVKAYGAKFVSSPAACDHIRRRYGVAASDTLPTECFQTTEVLGFRITPFTWHHRDISPARAVWRKGHVIKGLKWAWDALYQSPFAAPFYGFHVVLPDGTTLVNYGEGMNSKFVPAEAREVVNRLGKPDILIAGAQCFFAQHVADGAREVGARTVILHHPHEKMFKMIGAKSSTPDEFTAAVRAAQPQARVLHVDGGWTSATATSL